MKILVVSLLRLGDVIMCTPVLKGLRQRFPDAEIHLLLNKQFSGLTALLAQPDRVFYFDRDQVQKGLGEKDRAVFESYDRVSELINELNAENYTSVINLTQNRLSGWVMSLIGAEKRMGLEFDRFGKPTFGSPWFEHLNQQVETFSEDGFHFTDIFKFANGFEETSLGIDLRETENGQRQAKQVLASFEGNELQPIIIQPLTSDTKKDWGLSRFREALRIFAASHKDVPVLILGAPNEREKLTPFIESLVLDGVRASLSICDLECAFSLLKNARLLLTGDTSIKHLACAAGTPIVELSLGSSDLYRTGAYLHGSVIIQSREACAPCPHGKPCSRERQFCAEKIPVESVALTLREVYNGRNSQWRIIADEFKDEISIFKVDNKLSGFWSAYSLTETFADRSIGRWLDLCSGKIHLEIRSRFLTESDKIGTKTLQLQSFLKQIHPEVSDHDWRHLYSDLERMLIAVETRLRSLEPEVRVLHGTYESPKQMNLFVNQLVQLREKVKQSPSLRSQQSALDLIIEDDISPSFVRFRKIIEVLKKLRAHAAIEMKILRTLQTQLESDL